MRVDVLFKKEEIEDVIIDQSSVAIVLDILLATTTITSVLSNGAKHVIPALNQDEALEIGEKYNQEEICYIGEYAGIVLDHFLNPAPSMIADQVKNKKVILSTTNGTVAIRNSSSAKEIYIASLLNAEAVIKEVSEKYSDKNIIIICSGSSNRFNLEDFYGAGYLISKLKKLNKNKHFFFTDSAKSAILFYSQYENDSEMILRQSQVGQNLEFNGLDDDIRYASQKSSVRIVPRFVNDKIII